MIENAISLLIGNPLVSGVVGVFSAAFFWKAAGWAWDKFRPLKNILEYSEKWAEKKGTEFATFYKKRIPNKDFRKKTIKELAESSNVIQEAFVRGLLSVD